MFGNPKIICEHGFFYGRCDHDGCRHKASSGKSELLGVSALQGPYGDVLNPFLFAMETELHANSGKGDRLGWLAMTREQAMLEIYYHVSKLQKAVKDDDSMAIVEHSADVANMAMMLADVCGVIDT